MCLLFLRLDLVDICLLRSNRTVYHIWARDALIAIRQSTSDLWCGIWSTSASFRNIALSLVFAPGVQTWPWDLTAVQKSKQEPIIKARHSPTSLNSAMPLSCVERIALSVNKVLSCFLYPLCKSLPFYDNFFDAPLFNTYSIFFCAMILDLLFYAMASFLSAQADLLEIGRQDERQSLQIWAQFPGSCLVGFTLSDMLTSVLNSGCKNFVASTLDARAAFFCLSWDFHLLHKLSPTDMLRVGIALFCWRWR